MEKKGLLSCCKCLFEKIGTNLPHIQAENLKNPKNAFLAQSSGSQWVKVRIPFLMAFQLENFRKGEFIKSARLILLLLL